MNNVVYAVVLQSWEYGDDWYYGDNKAQLVYRNKKTAEDACARMNRDEVHHHDWNGGPHKYVVVPMHLHTG